MNTTPLDTYWLLRLQAVAERLRKNHFGATVVATVQEACHHVLREIVPQCGPRVSFGGSMSVTDSGLYAALKAAPGLEILDTVDYTVARAEMLERRRQALHCDLFVMGTNAITDDGRLVNLDMIGNRVGALHFGPRDVVVVAGRNKLVADLDAAVRRIKEVAAPANAIRLQRKTPCAKTGVCQDCSSPERICNVWTITDKAFPAGRIRVVLVNQELGL